MPTDLSYKGSERASNQLFDATLAALFCSFCSFCKVVVLDISGALEGYHQGGHFYASEK